MPSRDTAFVPSRKPPPEPRRLTIVLAQWCSHCVPLSIRNGKRLATRLKVPLRTLDIDRGRQATLADRMVKAYGDASPDYLIPQVFLEWSDGRVDHLLTGFSEQAPRTAQAWRDLLASDWIGKVRARGSP